MAKEPTSPGTFHLWDLADTTLTPPLLRQREARSFFRRLSRPPPGSFLASAPPAGCRCPAAAARGGRRAAAGPGPLAAGCSLLPRPHRDLRPRSSPPGKRLRGRLPDALGRAPVPEVLAEREEGGCSPQALQFHHCRRCWCALSVLQDALLSVLTLLKIPHSGDLAACYYIINFQTHQNLGLPVVIPKV